MSQTSQAPSPDHVPGTSPAPATHQAAQGEASYQTGKGCITLLGFLLICAAIMVVLIMIFGNREP